MGNTCHFARITYSFMRRSFYSLCLLSLSFGAHAHVRCTPRACTTFHMNNIRCLINCGAAAEEEWPHQNHGSACKPFDLQQSADRLHRIECRNGATLFANPYLLRWAFRGCGICINQPRPSADGDNVIRCKEITNKQLTWADDRLHVTRKITLFICSWKSTSILCGRAMRASDR